MKKEKTEKEKRDAFKLKLKKRKIKWQSKTPKEQFCELKKTISSYPTNCIEYKKIKAQIKILKKRSKL